MPRGFPLLGGSIGLDRGALEEAGASLTEAVQLEPQHAEALKLQERLKHAIEERARLEEADDDARDASADCHADSTGQRPGRVGRDPLLNEALGLNPGTRRSKSSSRSVIGGSERRWPTGARAKPRSRASTADANARPRSR